VSGSSPNGGFAVSGSKLSIMANQRLRRARNRNGLEFVLIFDAHAESVNLCNGGTLALKTDFSFVNTSRRLRTSSASFLKRHDVLFWDDVLSLILSVE
jgi:hypothetical protein